ncbi:hypothetical protein [Sphingobacterium anhuiense]|uniref:hypothetical protein n=1 Tax=Sphingobacterium anhuiense TaxID=493780 RepID=UPI003C2D8F9C
MPAHFNDNFWTENGRQLRRPTLDCLVMDSMKYETLLFQINEEIGYDDTGIWIINEERVALKFNTFFDIAINRNVALAITPEYSCPWHILTNILQQDKFPTSGKIWVLGMASIHPLQLKQIINDNDNITWIYDEVLIDEKIQTAPNKFFDPVCSLLNTIDNNGTPKKVIIIQFKNYPFGGADSHWERDNLILGRTFYVIKNQFESVRLITLICSDTLDNLNFRDLQDGMFITAPLMILHIQLNQKPFANNYKLYRNILFQMGTKDSNKEVICLNWARNVQIFGEDKVFNKVAGSALYLKSQKLEKTDDCINLNHKRGMYYLNWESKRAHVYLLNFDEYIYIIENTKASQEGADATQFNRSGPNLSTTYRWIENTWQIENNRVDDGFDTLVYEIENGQVNLDCLRQNENYLDIERMVQFCSGEIKFDKEWFLVSNMISCIVDDPEETTRVIFTQQNIENKMQERKKKLNNYAILKHSIITNPNNLPIGMVNPELKFSEVSKMESKYLINLHSEDGGMNATAVYLGSTSETEALKKQNKISDLFNESQYGKTVMVWYESVLGRQRIPAIFSKPSISDTTNKKSNSISKTKEL